MTGVYSGGLAYEYTMEENKYGIVKINGDDVEELPEFATLQKQFAATSDPAGDGGYNKTAGASNCPIKSDNWNVTGTALPAIPEEAKKFMTEGAGKGIGLEGPGSHNGKGISAGIAQAGSGAVTATASGTAASGSSTASGNAASGFRQARLEVAPFVVSALIVGFTGLGAFML